MGWIERFDSRKASISVTLGGRSSIDLRYTATGTEDDATIRNSVELNSPMVFANLFRQSYDVEHLGRGVWDVVVHYGITDPEESVFNFDTTGATTHITQSLSTISRTPVGAPDLKGAIGFDGERVEGTDIQIPKYTWNEQHKIPAPSFTGAYRKILRDLTSKVNNGTFRGFAAGEVQFKGANGSQRGEHDVEITYYFDSSENLTNLPVGSLTVPAKKGFEYLWVRYKKLEDAANNRIKTEPDSAYVEQVYYLGNFSLLAIGV